MSNPGVPWSYSKLSLYKKCPHAFKLRYIDKVRTPTGAAAERGIKMHEDIENYIQGVAEVKGDKYVPVDLAARGLKGEVIECLASLRDKYIAGLRGVLLEDMRGYKEAVKNEPYNLEKMSTPPAQHSDNVGIEVQVKVNDAWALLDNDDRGYWAQFIYDIVIYNDGERDEIIDIKTGKFYETHVDQAALYALSYFKVTGVAPKVMFLYVDRGESMDFNFGEDELAARENEIRGLLRVIGEDRVFQRSGRGCEYCDFRRAGHCV